MENGKTTLRLINPGREGLTPEKLRTFKGYENLNDSEAQELTNTIKIFASLLYKVANMEKENQTNNTNQIKKAA